MRENGPHTSLKKTVTARKTSLSLLAGPPTKAANCTRSCTAKSTHSSSTAVEPATSAAWYNPFGRPVVGGVGRCRKDSEACASRAGSKREQRVTSECGGGRQLAGETDEGKHSRGSPVALGNGNGQGQALGNGNGQCQWAMATRPNGGV